MVDRILLVLKIKNLTPSKFADEIGIQRSSMSHIMSGRNLPSLDLITKILKKYPDINSEWLLQGAGPMLKTIQIDLFDQQNEPKLPDVAEKKELQPVEPEIVKEEKTIVPESSLQEKASENLQPEIKQPETKPADVVREEVKQVDDKDVKHESIEENKPVSQPEIEKIVILYKNKTFKEYYPG